MSQEPEAGLVPTFRSYCWLLVEAVRSHKLVHESAGAKGGWRQDGLSSNAREAWSRAGAVCGNEFWGLTGRCGR